MEQAEQPMDLSHYDLVDMFTARQAACLIAGIDPNMQDVAELYGSSEFARMRAVEDGMEQAYGYAKDAVWEDLKEHPPGLSVFPENPPWIRAMEGGEVLEPQLPSTALCNFWRGVSFENLDANPDDFNRQMFKRDDICRWLLAKRFLGARYFLPKLTAVGELERDAHDLHAVVQQLREENARLIAELEHLRGTGPQVAEVSSAVEREKLLRHIGGLALELARQQKRYKSGDKPNASQIAEAVGELIDALPDVSSRGMGKSSMRASISEGVKLLK